MDTSLTGLDQGELITIPSLPDDSDWEPMELARKAQSEPFSRQYPAVRYGLDRIRGCRVDPMLRGRAREIPLILQE